MSKDQHSAQDFDHIFRKKLGGHSAPPPAGMWENINTNTQTSKKRRGLFWIIINDSTIMLLILLLSVFSFSGAYFSNDLAASENVHETDWNDFNKTAAPTTNNSDNKPSSDLKSNSVQTEIEVSEESTETDEPKTSGEQTNYSNSKQFDASNSNSGKLADTENTNEDELARNEDASASSTSSPQPTITTEPLATIPKVDSDVETSEPAATADIRTKSTTESPSVSEPQATAFGWALMNTISPSLSPDLFEVSLEMVSLPELPKDLTGTRDHEVFAGAHVNFNLPLIFNQNTYGVFGGKELAYKPTFGLASGVRLGYTYKGQYGFQAGFIFYSRQGQDYDDKFSGLAAKRQVKLQYMQVPIILRYKFKIKKQRKFESPWVINLGTQIGILQSAEITYVGNEFPLLELETLEDDDINYFKPIDVSVVLGVEKEIYFTKWLMLSVGMRTAFSGDINAKDHPVENDGKDYSKSHNFTFGFTLGLNYYLRR